MPSKKQRIYEPKITYSCDYKRWEVESETHKGHKYSVKVDIFLEHLVCTCPWGRGRALKENKDCKHVVAVKKWLNDLPEDIRRNYL